VSGGREQKKQIILIKTPPFNINTENPPPGQESGWGEFGVCKKGRWGVGFETTTPHRGGKREKELTKWGKTPKKVVVRKPKKMQQKRAIYQIKKRTGKRDPQKKNLPPRRPPRGRISKRKSLSKNPPRKAKKTRAKTLTRDTHPAGVVPRCTGRFLQGGRNSKTRPSSLAPGTEPRGGGAPRTNGYHLGQLCGAMYGPPGLSRSIFKTLYMESQRTPEMEKHRYLKGGLRQWRTKKDEYTYMAKTKIDTGLFSEHIPREQCNFLSDDVQVSYQTRPPPGAPIRGGPIHEKWGMNVCIPKEDKVLMGKKKGTAP